MTRFLIIVFIFLNFCFSSLGQTVNIPHDDDLRLKELKKGINHLNKNSLVDCLIRISIEYGNFYQMGCSFDNTDSALLYASNAYNEASKFGYDHGKIYSLLLLAKGEIFKENNEAAIKYLSNSLLADSKINNDTLSGEKYFIKGELALHTDHNGEAERNYKIANEFFLKAGAIKKQGLVFKGLSDVYSHLGDNEKSFDYGYKAYEAFQSPVTSFDHAMIVWSLVTMSEAYNTAGDYRSAVNYLLSGISYSRAHDVYDEWLPYPLAGLYTEMGRYDSAEYYLQKGDFNNPFHRFQRGELYLAEKNFTKAIGFLTSGLDSLKKYDPEATFSHAYIGIGKAYLFAGKIFLAKNFANEGFYLATKYNEMSELMEGSELLSNIYSRIGRYDSAYFFYKKFTAVKDSTLSKQFLLKLYFSKIISDNEKGKIQLNLLAKDNALNKQELRQKAFLQRVLVFSLFIVALIGTILLWIISLRRKNDKLEYEKKRAQLKHQTVELEMQALRAQMNPHFIFNCMNSINRFIFKNENEAASKYITRFSKLIRMILTHSQKQAVSLENEVEMLQLYLDMERLRFKDSFHYNFNVPSNEEMEMMYIPPLIMQPFCENAIWHGLLPKKGDSQLDISVFKEGDLLNCIISDNGIGRMRSAASKTQKDENNSMGLKITYERLALFNDGKLNEGFFEIEDLMNDNGDANGTRVKIKIAYKRMPFA